MKKLLVIGAMCALSALGAYAQYKTWCGIVVETVDDSNFDSEDEAADFHADLDVAYCGSVNPNP